MKARFTPEQIRHWYKYEGVRQEGLFNMFDPNATALTGLTREEYLFVMSNYSELELQAQHDACKAPKQDMNTIFLEEEAKLMEAHKNGH